MEKINYLPNGQWTLEKGVMKRLAPKPDPKAVKGVGGGSASQYGPIEDASHKKRAQYMLMKDMRIVQSVAPVVGPCSTLNVTAKRQLNYGTAEHDRIPQTTPLR